MHKTLPYIAEKDLYWLAGWLEGEGSFCWHYTNKRKYKYPMIVGGSTDEDVIAKCAGLLNRSYLKHSLHNGRPSTKHMYRFRLVGKQAATVMLIIHHLMGIRRQEKIKSILEEYNAN